MLPEDSFVGSIAEGRALAENLNAMETTIQVQGEAIADLKQSVHAISGDLYDARAELAKVPGVLQEFENKMNASLEAAHSAGYRDALKLGGILALIGGAVAILK